MDYELIQTSQGPVAQAVFSPEETISDYSTFFDAVMGAPAGTLAVAREKITDRFFDLKTGPAGEILQKVSTYRKRLVILGDFSKIDSKSLGDFIRESNRTGKVLFVKTIKEAQTLLR